TTLSASHSSDQTGWSSFFSTSSADVNTSVAGEVSLSPSLNSSIQTSASDFSTWATSSIFVSSTGSSGRIVLLKPVGATCNQASECGSSACNATTHLCWTPPCGSLTTVDYSGQTYNLINIGSQCWFSQNLNVGTMLASAATLPSNNSLIEKWCYDNSTANCTTYGGLYTWAEANQLATTCDTNSCAPSSPSQGICPSGWHIPTDTEITTLETSQGADPSTKLKSGGSSGFNFILAGRRTSSPIQFNSFGGFGYLWSASQSDASTSWYRYFNSTSAIGRSATTKANGFSVRCLKN
ncbi:MAG: fibrobacter succinogenes major paralogous domain-containing protein, partial [Candidatus Magasanikbacteria bacterium]